MKKYFQRFMMLLIVASSLSFVSCQKQTAAIATEALDVKLSKDQAFKDVLTSAADLGTKLDIQSLNNDANIAELRSIAASINNKTATPQDYNRVKAITGVAYDEFILDLQKFGLALNTLAKKYPEMSKMNQNDLSATFTKAIKANPELQNFIGNPAGVTGRIAACPLKDLCNLAVILAKIFGGDALCAAISVSTIPVIGGVLCQIILTIGVSILTAICNALPC
ncbi:MAG: hypothetical protein IPM95_09455 [Sphingobacteriales bacterium]|jgi:hypothetical protein|nr:hypothetical protein [Sphingobacteriales bacterium]